MRGGSPEGSRTPRLLPTLTDDEDEEGAGHQEAEVLRGASELLSDVGFASGVAIEVLPDAVSPDLLVHVRGQLHLHLAVISFHVLGQVEAGVGVRLPVELQTPPTKAGIRGKTAISGPKQLLRPTPYSQFWILSTSPGPFWLCGYLEGETNQLRHFKAQFVAFPLRF